MCIRDSGCSRIGPVRECTAVQISDEHVAGTLSMRLEWMCPSVRQWSIVEYARIGGGQQAACVGSREIASYLISRVFIRYLCIIIYAEFCVV